MCRYNPDAKGQSLYCCYSFDAWGEAAYVQQWTIITRLFEVMAAKRLCFLVRDVLTQTQSEDDDEQLEHADSNAHADEYRSVGLDPYH